MEEVVDSTRVVSRSRRYYKALLRLVGATLCIMVAIAIWVIQAEKFQDLNKHYKQPYFISYLFHSSYVYLYLLWKIWILFPGNCSCNQVGEGYLVFNIKLVVISGLLALARIGSAYFWNMSLPRTNIPANTAIYQSAAAIVFIISVPLLKERITALKVFCVLLSICGVTLVSFYSTNVDCSKPNGTNVTSTDGLYKGYNDTNLLMSSNKNDPCVETSTPLGYVLLMVSVLCYAIFETFYKKFGTVKDDPASVMNGIRYVGYIGVHTLFWLWPPIIILHYSKIEVFHWPTWKQLEMIALGQLTAVGYIGMLVTAIVLVSPLFATVGTILAIPASVIVDWIIQGEVLVWQAFLGIVFIILGFSGFTFSEFLASRREEKEREREKRMPQINSSLGSSETIASSENVPLIINSDSKHQLSWRRRISEHISWI